VGKRALIEKIPPNIDLIDAAVAGWVKILISQAGKCGP
jgi:hypothetical protein